LFKGLDVRLKLVVLLDDFPAIVLVIGQERIHDRLGDVRDFGQQLGRRRVDAQRLPNPLLEPNPRRAERLGVRLLDGQSASLLPEVITVVEPRLPL
jgi:hypothetical protein